MRKDVANQIKLLREMELLNKSEIARRLGCNRRTVDRYLEEPREEKEVRKKRDYVSVLENYKSTIIEKVDKYGASSMGTYKFIQKKGYAGSYLTVNNFVRKHKNEEVKKATIRFETTPGLQGQVDWKETVTMINKNGEKFTINIFLIVLGYSRLKFIRLTSDKRQKTLFECMYEAFKYFKGIPKEILFDNMKTVVDREKSTFSNVVLNNTFKAFSMDAGFEIITCRAYRAKTKGKVETLAKLMDRLRAYNEEFESFEDLNKIILEFNDEINNEISQAINKKPIDRFEEEKEYLSPLVNENRLLAYFSGEKEYKVYPDSMITYKGQKYSVPIRLMGKCVNISEREDFIEIYYESDLVSTHPKSEKMLNYKIEDAIEILKSDALKGCNNDFIKDFVENNLKKMDMMLT